MNPKIYLNTGSSANDGNGLSLREAFWRTDYNFETLFAQVSGNIADILTVSGQAGSASSEDVLVVSGLLSGGLPNNAWRKKDGFLQLYNYDQTGFQSLWLEGISGSEHIVFGPIEV